MKNYIFVLFVAIVFCFCNKNVAIINPIDTNPIPIDTIAQEVDTLNSIIEFGKSSMKKDGKIWDVPVKALFYGTNRDRFFLSAPFQNGASLSGGFSFVDISCKLGKYSVENLRNNSLDNYIPNGGIGYMYEGDQPVGTFRPDTTRTDHFLEILRYDSISHIVEGRFQVFFLKEPNNLNFPGIPDSIFITEGKFHLKIKEQ
jgi:hypothetical protein